MGNDSSRTPVSAEPCACRGDASPFNQWQKIYDDEALGGEDGGRERAVGGHACVNIGCQSWAFGGQSAGGKCVNTMSVFDLDKLEWQRNACREGDQNLIPPPRRSPAMCALGDAEANADPVAADGRIFLSGGAGDHHETVLADAWIFDTRRRRWERLPDMPTALCGHSAVFFDKGAGGRRRYGGGGGGGTVAVFGGCGASCAFSGDVLLLDVAAWRWSRAACGGPAPAPRYKHQAVVARGSMYVIGGGDFRPIEEHLDVHALDLRTMQWSRPETSGAPVVTAADPDTAGAGADVAGIPAGRTAHSAACDPVTGSLFVWGGFTRELSHLGDMHVLNLATMRWSAVPSLPHPAAAGVAAAAAPARATAGAMASAAAAAGVPAAAVPRMDVAAAAVEPPAGGAAVALAGVVAAAGREDGEAGAAPARMRYAAAVIAAAGALAPALDAPAAPPRSNRAAARAVRRWQVEVVDLAPGLGLAEEDDAPADRHGGDAAPAAAAPPAVAAGVAVAAGGPELRAPHVDPGAAAPPGAAALVRPRHARARSIGWFQRGAVAAANAVWGIFVPWAMYDDFNGGGMGDDGEGGGDRNARGGEGAAALVRRRYAGCCGCDSCECCEAAAPEPRSFHQSVFYNGSFFVMGGSYGAERKFGDVWRFRARQEPRPLLTLAANACLRHTAVIPALRRLRAADAAEGGGDDACGDGSGAPTTASPSAAETGGRSDVGAEGSSSGSSDSEEPVEASWNAAARARRLLCRPRRHCLERAGGSSRRGSRRQEEGEAPWGRQQAPVGMAAGAANAPAGAAAAVAATDTATAAAVPEESAAAAPEEEEEASPRSQRWWRRQDKDASPLTMQRTTPRLRVRQQSLRLPRSQSLAAAPAALQPPALLPSKSPSSRTCFAGPQRAPAFCGMPPPEEDGNRRQRAAAAAGEGASATAFTPGTAVTMQPLPPPRRKATHVPPELKAALRDLNPLADRVI